MGGVNLEGEQNKEEVRSKEKRLMKLRQSGYSGELKSFVIYQKQGGVLRQCLILHKFLYFVCTHRGRRS